MMPWYKCFVFVFVIVLGSSSMTVFWYFEDRLLCDVQDDQVQVSIDTQADDTMHTYCFTILQRLAQRITTLEADQNRARRYSTQWSVDDRRYREQVVLTLEDTVIPYRMLRDLITSAMKDYEQELFFSVKNLVKTYLREESETLNQRLEKAYTLKVRIVSLWNNQQFEFIKNKIQERETQRMVLLAIRNAASFDTLIPALRSYFWLQQPTTDTL